MFKRAVLHLLDLNDIFKTNHKKKRVFIYIINVEYIIV